MPIFNRRTEYPVSVETLFGWHRRPGAFQRMTPPWESVEILQEEGDMESGGTVLLGLHKGPARLQWKVGYTAYETNRLFQDEQISGPFGAWRHAHRFHPMGPDRSILEDEVEWAPPLGSLGSVFATGFLQGTLERLFAFRHERLRHDLELAVRYSTGSGRRYAITGATGLLGSSLTGLLRSQGHTVLRITRSPSEPHDVGWDPGAGELDAGALEGLDGLVHLAGESIAGVRWTAKKKQAIRRSRVEGTGLVARTLADLKRPPPVLISASAVGFYGDTGDRLTDERAPGGDGFLAGVCKAWEEAAQPARRKDIRTVHLRTGMVLSPAGGALGTMLLPFQLGAGGRLGSGRQYVPWVDLDDVVGLILHALNTPSLEGPMNLTGPNPVTNATFTSTLGRVLGRPTLLPVPAPAIKLALGEMGTELLLRGQRAVPRVAEESGYRFLKEELEASLRFQLGRASPSAE
ncbi:MAG: TIGR01777 family oxidoreductase [Gemmatimonadota bacterium]